MGPNEKGVKAFHTRGVLYPAWGCHTVSPPGHQPAALSRRGSGEAGASHGPRLPARAFPPRPGPTVASQRCPPGTPPSAAPPGPQRHAPGAKWRRGAGGARELVTSLRGRGTVGPHRARTRPHAGHPGLSLPPGLELRALRASDGRGGARSGGGEGGRGAPRPRPQGGPRVRRELGWGRGSLHRPWPGPGVILTC